MVSRAFVPFGMKALFLLTQKTQITKFDNKYMEEIMLKSEYEILKEANKVVLAYSGGLDTSVMVTWLKKNGVKEVICVSVDLGQVKDPDALELKPWDQELVSFII